MSKKQDRLWCALVIKHKLSGGGNDNISDVKFCWAKDFDTATKVFRNANWPQHFWVEGKSQCRIIKLFEVFSDEFMSGSVEKLESVLSKDVLRCLPIEQVGGPQSVEERTEETATSSPTTSKNRRQSAVEKLQSSAKKTDSTKKSSGVSRRRKKRPSPEVEPPTAQQSPDDIAEGRRSRRLQGASSRLAKESQEPTTRRRRKRK